MVGYCALCSLRLDGPVTRDLRLSADARAEAEFVTLCSMLLQHLAAHHREQMPVITQAIIKAQFALAGFLMTPAPGEESGPLVKWREKMKQDTVDLFVLENPCSVNKVEVPCLKV